MTESPSSSSQWERLSQDPQLTLKELVYLYEAGIDQLPPLNKSFIINPETRNILKRTYLTNTLGIDIEELASISGWSVERIEKFREKVDLREFPNLPIAGEIICKIIACAQICHELRENDQKPEAEYMLLALNSEIAAARLKKQMRNEKSGDNSLYSFAKERGYVPHPGLESLTSETLVATMKLLEQTLTQKTRLFSPAH